MPSTKYSSKIPSKKKMGLMLNFLSTAEVDISSWRAQNGRVLGQRCLGHRTLLRGLLRKRDLQFYLKVQLWPHRGAYV